MKHFCEFELEILSRNRFKGCRADVKGFNQKLELLKRRIDDVEDEVLNVTCKIDEGFYTAYEEMDRMDSRINELMGRQECKNNSWKSKKRYR